MRYVIHNWARDAHEPIETFKSRMAKLRGVNPGVNRHVSQGIDLNDAVARRSNPRHVGRVTKIVNSAYADVIWNNGWRETDVPLQDLERIR